MPILSQQTGVASCPTGLNGAPCELLPAPQRKPFMQAARPCSRRRRRWLFGGLTVLIMTAAVLVGCWWHAVLRTGAPDPVREVLLRPSPLRVSPGIYLLGRLDPAAAYAIETSE